MLIRSWVYVIVTGTLEEVKPSIIISSIILALVKTLAKLCSGIYIRLEVLYCHTHEVAISNQGSIIQLKKHIRPLLWVPECKVKTKPRNRHLNPLLICYISWIRIEWFVFNIQAALFVIVLEPM